MGNITQGGSASGVSQRCALRIDTALRSPEANLPYGLQIGDRGTSHLVKAINNSSIEVKYFNSKPLPASH